MKRNILYLLGTVSLLFAVTSNVLAQEGDLKKTVIQFEQIKDTVYVKLTIDLSAIKLKTQQEQSYIPTIYTPTKSIELPCVVLRGRESYLNHNRQLALMNNAERAEYDNELPYASLKEFGKGERVVDYEFSLPYEAWMADAKLVLKRDVILCGDYATRESEMLAAMRLEPIAIVPTAVDILINHPFVAHISTYEDDLKAIGTSRDLNALRIYYRLDKRNIDPDYMSNKVELERMKVAIDEISKSKDLNVAKILIAGFSSIEGTYNYNTALSLSRAMSIYNHIFSNVKIDSTIIDIYNGAENWVGLRELVKESDMSDKTEILTIIDTVDEPNKRERRLKQINNGIAYKYMQDNFFAELRHGGYIKVYFDHEKDEVAEQINKAIKFIETNQYAEALDILEGVSSDERAETAIGVCYMMLGDIATATKYLQRAANKGDNVARQNLEQIKAKDSK